MRRAAKQAKKEFQDNIQDIKRNLDPKRLFAMFNAQRKLLTEQRTEFRVTSEGSILPDPKKAIQAYFDSDETKAVYRQLEEDSTTKKTLTVRQMPRLSRQYLKRLFSKLGIRLQVFGSAFTRQKFWDAVNGNPASFPYLRPDQNQNKDLDQANINPQLNEDMPLYVRRDPTQADPGDPNDPRKKDEFQLYQGISIPILYHKTGHKYIIHLWFSQVETYYLRMYESITAKYCKARNINLLENGSLDPESPFFIDGKGRPTVHTHMYPLDFSDFAASANIPGATSYIFRKMFSGLLLAQEDLALREAEEWTMGHAPETAKNSYQDALTTKLMACK